MATSENQVPDLSARLQLACLSDGAQSAMAEYLNQQSCNCAPYQAVMMGWSDDVAKSFLAAPLLTQKATIQAIKEAPTKHLGGQQVTHLEQRLAIQGAINFGPSDVTCIFDILLKGGVNLMKLELDELCSVKDDAALVERIVSKVFEATRKRMETPAFDGVRVAFERLQPSVEVLLQFLRISKDDHALAFIQDHFRTSTHRQDERAACIMRLERRVLSSFDISLFKLLTSNISHEDIARLDESSDDDWVVNRILAEVPAAAMARLEKSAFQSVADLHVVPLRGLPVETLLKFLKIQQDAPALIYIQRCLDKQEKRARDRLRKRICTVIEQDDGATLLSGHVSKLLAQVSYEDIIDDNHDDDDDLIHWVSEKVTVAAKKRLAKPVFATQHARAGRLLLYDTRKLSILLTFLLTSNDDDALEYLRTHLSQVPPEARVLSSISETISISDFEAQWSKPTAPSREKPTSVVAQAWQDTGKVSWSPWSLDFATLLLQESDISDEIKEAAHLLSMMFKAAADPGEKSRREPWYQERYVSSIANLVLNAIFCKDEIYFGHNYCLGAAAMHVDIMAVMLEPERHPKLPCRPVAFGECKMGTDDLLSDTTKAQLSSEAHLIIQQITTRSETGEYKKLAPPMVNINASRDCLQLQLVVPVSPSHPFARLAGAKGDCNSLVVIPLVELDLKETGDEAMGELCRALMAMKALLNKLKTINTTDRPVSWIPLLPPEDGYVFDKRLSPHTQLWKRVDAGSAKSSNKVVVKEYDYYKRPNLVYYRHPLTMEQHKELAAINPEYLTWKVVDLLKDGEDKVLVQHVRYNFVKGRHWPDNQKQFGTLLKLVLCFHAMGLVHGDILPRNVLFYKETALLIDHDLHGQAGTARYPHGFNVSGILQPYRHPDAIACEVMKKEHDCYALKAFVKEAWPTDNVLIQLLESNDLKEAISHCKTGVPASPRRSHDATQGATGSPDRDEGR